MRQHRNSNRVMEFRDHFKNGANPKSLLSRINIPCICFLLLMPVVFSSCATILSGSKQQVTVTGNVNLPVDLIVDGELYSHVKLPAKVKIKKKNETSKIAVFVPNYRLEKQELEKTFNHLVWTNALGGILFPVFMYVDWNKGANKKAVQNEIALEFIQASSEKEVFDTYIDFGTEYYDIDHLDEALFYFQQAYEIDSISDVALEKINSVYNRMDYLEERKRLKAEKNEKTIAFLGVLAGGLNAAAEVAGTLQSTKSSSGSYSSGSNSGGGDCCNNIQNVYNHVKKGLSEARRLYNDKSRSATTHAMDGQNLRNFQQQERELKQQARKCGCSLY